MQNQKPHIAFLALNRENDLPDYMIGKVKCTLNTFPTREWNILCGPGSSYTVSHALFLNNGGIRFHFGQLPPLFNESVSGPNVNLFFTKKNSVFMNVKKVVPDEFKEKAKRALQEIVTAITESPKPTMVIINQVLLTTLLSYSEASLIEDRTFLVNKPLNPGEILYCNGKAKFLRKSQKR